MSTIPIAYKCYCMKTERTVQVPARPHGSDLLIWMNVVQSTIHMDHAATAPNCRATTMEYAKIPVEDGAEGIGEKPKLAS